MDREALSKARAEVIEKSINLEWIINAIISQHYFKRVYLAFVLDFLYDEYCSFALKRRLIEKIVKDIDSNQIQNLNRLNTIRNIFAHCGQEIFEGSAIPSKDQIGKVPHPRKTNEALDFKGLHQEFLEKESKVVKYLFGIYENLGGLFQKGE